MELASLLVGWSVPIMENSTFCIYKSVVQGLCDYIYSWSTIFHSFSPCDICDRDILIKISTCFELYYDTYHPDSQEITSNL